MYSKQHALDLSELDYRCSIVLRVSHHEIWHPFNVFRAEISFGSDKEIEKTYNFSIDPNVKIAHFRQRHLHDVAKSELFLQWGSMVKCVRLFVGSTESSSLGTFKTMTHVM